MGSSPPPGSRSRQPQLSVDGFHRILLLVLLAFVGAWLYFDEPQSEAPALDPRTAIPAGASLLLTADLERLRKSTLGRRLLGEKAQALVAGPTCEGYDPSLGARRLALALPREGERPVPQLAVSGRFDAARLSSCFASRLPAHHSRDSDGFKVIAAVGEASALGVRQDLALLASGAQLDQLLKAATHRSSNVKSDKTHRLLREAVGANGSVVLSWILEDQALFRELGLEVLLTPLGHLEALAARADASPEPRVDLTLFCRSKSSCAFLRGYIERRWKRLGRTTQLLLGYDLSQRTQIEISDRRIDIVLRLTSSEALQLLDRVDAMLESKAPTPSPTGSTNHPPGR